MRVTTLLLLAAVVFLATSGTAAAADNTAPMPEAGVDQTVVVNSTVYLDGTASTDPDGGITDVSWSIETPSGGTISPACADCNRTQFDATALGQYTVTLTVTDDDGATRSDTLYVTTTNESGPDVSVSGPTSTAPGGDATFTANVSAADAPLQTLTWLVNGSVVERESLNGSSANVSFTHSFDEGTPVRAVVYDTLGNRGSVTQRVSVGSGGGGGGSDDDGQTCFATYCKSNSGADSRHTVGGTTTITNTNGKDGLQTYDEEKGELRTIKNPRQNPKITRGNNGEWRIEGGLSSLDEDDFKSTDDETGESGGSGSPTSEISSDDFPRSIFDGPLDSLPLSGGGSSTNHANVGSTSGGGGSIGNGLLGL